MKQIENLLKEYKIRFYVTDKIKDSKNLFGYIPTIDFNVVFNKNGKVYKNGKWKIADVKELPDKWVVEKDETSPLWDKFKDIYKLESVRGYMPKYLSDKDSSDRLIHFENHQYLTLEQWAEFCLPKVDFFILNDEEKHPELAPLKVGDLGLYFDNPKDIILDLKRGIVIIGILTSISNHAFKVNNIHDWAHFYKIDMINEPLQSQIDEFIEIYKNK